MVGILIILVFVIAGVLTGLNISVPYSYSQYMAVAILACLDSVFGALSANMDNKFKMNIFISGFLGNAIIAVFLVFIGIKLNVDIYLAAVILFGGRIINNFATIRRQVISKIEEKRNSLNKSKNFSN